MDKINQMIKLLQKAEVEKALKIADKIKYKRKVATALNDFAASLADEIGDYDTAIMLTKKAISFDPDYPLAHYNLAMLYTEPEVLIKDNSRLSLAESEYRKATELDPDYAEAHHNLSLLLYFQRKFEGAEEEYKKAIKLQPKNTLIKNFGKILKHRKQKTKSKKKKKD